MTQKIDANYIIKTNIETTSYKEKPKDFGRISNVISQKSSTVELTAEAFIQNITEQGMTFTQGIMNGNGDKGWAGHQQIFAVDFDNTNEEAPHETVNSICQKFEEYGLNLFLVYQTFNSVETHRRYRAVLLCEEAICDPDEAKKIIDALVKISPQTDSSCVNLCRFFFGSNKGSEFVNYSTTSKEQLISFSKKTQENSAVKKATNKTTLPNTHNISSTTAISQLPKFGLAAFIREDTNQDPYQVKEGFMFPVCPICGHKDDFSVSTEKDLFYCHSVNGQIGGNLVTYLKHTRGIRHHEAKILAQEIRNGTFTDYLFLKKSVETVAMPSYIETKANGSEVIIPSLLAEYMLKNNDMLIVRFDSGKKDFYWYEKDIYYKLSDSDVMSRIKKEIDSYNIRLVQMKIIRETFELMSLFTETIPMSEMNTNENIIVFENGVLHLDTMQLTAHSPVYKTSIKIPCIWNESNTEAPVFTNFLNTISSGNKEISNLLLQFIGLAISNIPGWRTKKALFLCGKGNTGKTQLRNLVDRIIGQENCSGIDLSTLEEKFGLYEICFKRLVGSADMSGKDLAELKSFKGLTGGDTQFSSIKNTTGINFRFNGVLWFCANEMPKFGGDRGDWVYDRMIIVECTNVVPVEKRDPLILEKMYNERDAIVTMAVHALKEVLDNNYRLNIPKSCANTKDTYKKRNDSVKSFINECCNPKLSDDIDNMVTTREMHSVYKKWAVDKDYFVVNSQEFNNELGCIFNTDSASLIKRNSENRYFRFTLKSKIKRKYISQK